MQNQARALNSDVRQLAQGFAQLGRSMGASSGGGLVQGQVAGMRQLLGMQQQALQNQARLNAGGGSGRVPNVPGGGGIWGRRGFSPNASLADRAQHRAVGVGEQSLIAGFLGYDIARTNLRALASPRVDPNNPDRLLPGLIAPEVVDQIEREAVGLTQQFRSLNRSHVLDTFKELVTQFSSPDFAFALLPMMLGVQEWQVLQGGTVEQAREGNARLLRAMGLSGRLVDWRASTSAAPAMTSTACPSQLRLPLAGRTAAGPGTAASGIAGAAQLAQLHALVVEAVPFGEEPLPFLCALSEAPVVAGDSVLHVRFLGELLDVLQRGRDRDAVAHVMSGHDVAVPLG